MPTIEALWQRIEAWAADNAAAMLEELNPGANDAEIRDLQQELGRELPEAFLQSLRVHDGENDGWPNRVFADMGAYRSCATIVSDWHMQREAAEKFGEEFDAEETAAQIRDGIITVEGPVRPVSFDDAWIPIMNCNGDVFWALDFAPAEGGEPGQVIQVDLEGCEWRVIASGFAEFLNDYAAALESGKFAIAEGLATQYPPDPEEQARGERIEAAFKGATDRDALRKLSPDSETEIVGYRSGVVKGDRCQLLIGGGEIHLRGSLRGSNFNQLMRVRIRVGSRRALGLLGPVHDILHWEFVER